MDRALTSPRAHPAGAPASVRWDRVGRVALVLLLAGVVALYVQPAVSYLRTYGQARRERAQVARLEARNRELRRTAAQLRSPATLERDARRLGMVRPGERPYVVRGLPGG